MGYRHELLQRLRDSGAWNQMTGDERNCATTLSDEKARRNLVMIDDFDMGKREAVAPLALSSFVAILTSFNGSLIVMDSMNRPNLSRAGMLFAEFIEELQLRGVDQVKIAEQFRALDWGAIVALMVIHQKLKPGK